jgi:hypothetical protein
MVHFPRCAHSASFAVHTAIIFCSHPVALCPSNSDRITNVRHNRNDDENAAWKARCEEMTPEEFEDAKSLWKFFYARECFKHAENACSFILESGMKENHPAYFPLISAIYVLYGKPFKRSSVVGKLPRDIVPEKFRALHDLMEYHRDQVYAHTDAHDWNDDEPGVPNQVRLVVSSTGEARLFGTEFYARPPFLPNVIALCRKMRTKVDHHIDRIQKRHQNILPKEKGEYPINVFDSAGDFFLPKYPPMFSDTD